MTLPALEPGDVLLVSRRRGFKSWARSPFGSLVSWRIQSSTGSKWNHVAAYVGNGQLLEAAWGKGIVRSKASQYDKPHYELAVAKPPPGVDPMTAVVWWRENAKPATSYDWRSIVLMRVAGLLYGHQGIKDVVRGKPGDDGWICSEWCTAGWTAAGYPIGDDVLVTPADFQRHVR